MRNSKLTDPDRKEREPEPTDWNETYDYIDVDLCNPYPSVAGMRFEYESEALEQNIKENGQLEPCRAVRSEEDGVHLLVYIGQRRLYAVKALKAKYGMPSTLKIIIDEDDISEEELVKRALAENIDENGQRLPLSDLEKVAYCRNLLRKYNGQKTEKILTNAGLERNTARKIIFLVDKFDNQRIERLHKIETKSNFRFKIAHLDLLLASEDEENLYETASLAAFSQKPPEEIKTLRQAARHFSKDIPWFGGIFPEFVLEDRRNEIEDASDDSKGKEPRDEYDSQGTTEAESSSSPEADEDDNHRESEPRFGALPEPVIMVICHYCESINPFKLRTGSPEFIFCNLKEEGSIEQLAVGANAVFDCERECSACGKSFWITASILEDGKLVVETSGSRTIEVPKQEASVRKVYWDQREGGWMLYDEASKKKLKLNSGESLITSTKEWGEVK
jgi:hypothetical protein